MINKLEISGCASYGDDVEVMDGLREINFVYGPNGAGKTTISRLIADSSPFSKCAVHWQRGTKLETFVYNRDFVDKNFNQPGDLKGIFTLGQKDIETQNKIAQAKLAAAEFTRKIELLTHKLQSDDGAGGKRGELTQLEDKFRDACWEVKKRHDAKLHGALTGYRGDKLKFKNRLFTECQKKAPMPLPAQSDLEARSASLFGTTPTNELPIATINDTQFLRWEIDPILVKRVIGKSDVDIAAMILRLGNSDWVKQGITYYELNDEYCPFCQQKAPQSLAASLEEYFDETFIRHTSAIAALKDGYLLAGERISQMIDAVLTTASRFLEADALKGEKQVFDARFQTNRQRLEQKAKEPSQSVTLEPLKDILQKIKDLIEKANSLIRDHNTMVANLEFAQTKLTSDVWAFFAHSEITAEFAPYHRDKKGLDAAISSLEQQIATATSEWKDKDAELRSLEKQTTSVRPTVDDINKLLNAFGFRSFSLEATSSNLYRLRRSDGSDAKETLSEGERSFITFLYFYHLLKGSESSSGITTDRVVVFDDPVSSLDSDVLFVVGSLIRQTLEVVRANRSHIKQVFILTHNVYFHKEITFHKNRSAGQAFKEETFWIIRKVDGKSKVQKYTINPIKTSYDLLWSEIRDASPQAPGIQNAMRRILEHYFRILGGIGYDEIADVFDGEEKLICKALFSWVNDGSHSIPDDVFMTFDDGAVQMQREVFKSIFVKTKHINHYNMMMGHPYVIESIAASGDPITMS
jgi:wobble nucleotide-excising tRNase